MYSTISLIALFLAIVALVIYAEHEDVLRQAGITVMSDEVFLKQSLETLKGHHVVFIGDSLTRYQYLALIHSLQFGTLVTESVFPSIVEERHWMSWAHFYNGTNNLFYPNEFCDCYRSKEQNVENRYFFLPSHSINVTYYCFYGTSIHGHWHDQYDFDKFRMPWVYQTDFFWDKTLFDFLYHTFAQLNPTPTLVVMNVGFHTRYMRSHQYNDPAILNDIVKAVLANTKNSSLTHKMVWKTTTFNRHESSEHKRISDLGIQDDERDEIMCSIQGVLCLNTSWTRYLPALAYWDEYHVRANSYNTLNKQLIQLLQQP